MGPVTLLITVAVVSLHCPSASAHTVHQNMHHSFNYDVNPRDPYGVVNWPRTYSNECGGRHQSPINVMTSRVLYDQPIACPRMVYMSNVVSGKLKNNGHAASFELRHPSDVELHDIPYRQGIYYLSNLHIHYSGHTRHSLGQPGFPRKGHRFMDKGSEHSIDGRRYDGELHFVFYNSKYLNRGDIEADSKQDGIIVIAAHVEKLAPWMPADSRETAMFSDFLEHVMPRVYALNTNVTSSLDMSMFFTLPCDFYTYAGSLTTPKCHEVVRWLLLKEPLHVTDVAWSCLAGLETEHPYHEKFGNCRPVQPTNGRMIEANFLPSDGSSFPHTTRHFGANNHAPMMPYRTLRHNTPHSMLLPPLGPRNRLFPALGLRDILLPTTSPVFPHMFSGRSMAAVYSPVIPPMDQFQPIRPLRPLPMSMPPMDVHVLHMEPDLPLIPPPG